MTKDQKFPSLLAPFLGGVAVEGGAAPLAALEIRFIVLIALKKREKDISELLQNFTNLSN